MYERLTKKSECADLITIKALCESCGEDACGDLCTEYLYKECKGCPVQEAFDRLAAYEDSGLSPEEVHEFAKAKACGRLVVLPCKVGDEIFLIDEIGRVRQLTVQDIGLNHVYAGMYQIPFSKFGKTVFLAKEETEKAIVEVGE